MIEVLRRAAGIGILSAIKVALAVLLLAGSSAFAGDAQASYKAASLEEVRAIDCQRQTYFGFENGATAEYCDSLFFLPTSAVFKCSLYKEAGYPSELMEKACMLYDRGYIQSFSDGIDSISQ